MEIGGLAPCWLTGLSIRLSLRRNCPRIYSTSWFFWFGRKTAVLPTALACVRPSTFTIWANCRRAYPYPPAIHKSVWFRLRLRCRWCLTHRSSSVRKALRQIKTSAPGLSFRSFSTAIYEKLYGTRRMIRRPWRAWVDEHPLPTLNSRMRHLDGTSLLCRNASRIALPSALPRLVDAVSRDLQNAAPCALSYADELILAREDTINLNSSD